MNPVSWSMFKRYILVTCFVFTFFGVSICDCLAQTRGRGVEVNETRKVETTRNYPTGKSNSTGDLLFYGVFLGQLVFWILLGQLSDKRNLPSLPFVLAIFLVSFVAAFIVLGKFESMGDLFLFFCFFVFSLIGFVSGRRGVNA